MPYVTVGKENSADIKIHHEDHGSGKPIVVAIADGPHNVGWTFPEEVNPGLLSFLAK